MSDPVDALAVLDRPVAPRGEFSEALLRACLDGLAVSQRRFHWSRPRFVLAAAAILLLLAGVATGTYLALRPAGRHAAGTAELTVILGSARTGPTAKIAVVEPGGRLRVVWHCPEPVFCGELTSIAWAPNGKLLAFTLDEIGGLSGYVGLHILDLRTGRDRHIPSLPIPHIAQAQSMSVLQALRVQGIARLGCPTPTAIAWSPDSTRLAYPCGVKDRSGRWRSAIRIIRADGTGQHPIRTRTGTAVWPSWSPDGRWLAFSTQLRPRVVLRTNTQQPHRIVRSQVWIMSLDGRRHRRLATGSAPSWSPDGSTIAYDTPCGIGLVALDGTGAAGGAPSVCSRVRVHGPPMWSPDGTQIAFGAQDGTYVAQPDGSGVHRLTRESGAGVYRIGRVAWAPLDALARLAGRTPQAGL